MNVVEIYRGFTIEEIKMTLHYKGKNHGDMPTFYGAKNGDNCIATANTVEQLKRKIDIFIDGGTDMNKTVVIKRDGNDIVVVANGKEVFRKPKTTQTVSIAHDIYMGYKYENGI